MPINIPLLGEVTMMRAFFLFIFFYSNDSNSLGTWSTFGAGMLLSNLGARTPGPRLAAAAAAATHARDARATLACGGGGACQLRRAAARAFSQRPLPARRSRAGDCRPGRQPRAGPDATRCESFPPCSDAPDRPASRCSAPRRARYRALTLQPAHTPGRAGVRPLRKPRSDLP